LTRRAARFTGDPKRRIWSDIMRKRFILAAVALLLIALGIGWYVTSPGWTVRHMVAAAKSNDADALASYVDFPALKADLRTDLTARLTAEAKGDNSPTARMGIAIARSMMDQVIDAFASPGGIRATFAVLDNSDAPPGGKALGKPKIERQGFNRFRLSRDNSNGSGFVFERRGFGWKLTGVDLPPNPPPAQRP
jgi:hypothetical protein